LLCSKIKTNAHARVQNDVWCHPNCQKGHKTGTSVCSTQRIKANVTQCGWPIESKQQQNVNLGDNLWNKTKLFCHFRVQVLSLCCKNAGLWLLKEDRQNHMQMDAWLGTSCFFLQSTNAHACHAKTKWHFRKSPSNLNRFWVHTKKLRNMFAKIQLGCKHP